MTGGGQSDTFYFEALFRSDTIQDFKDNATENDILEFSSAIFASFSDVVAASAQVGSDVVITISSSDRITVKAWNVANMGADDFLFV